mmetsp:Transcript_8293/g.30598  ORF Transcript_8293/g.30598 Transcript_8293/m.30598 type:complete len:210 (-) Transcript_8293:3541-4170(-)
MGPKGTSQCLECRFDSLPFDCAIHPTAPLIATGDIDGIIHLHCFDFSHSGSAPNESSASSSNDLELLAQAVQLREGASCRALQFAADGRHLYAGGADKRLLVLDVERELHLARRQKRAHNSPISAIRQIGSRGPHVIASADDEGSVRLWDLRQKACVHDVKVNEDFISSLRDGEDGRLLYCASGDGTLTVLNMNRGVLIKRSDHQVRLW